MVGGEGREGEGRGGEWREGRGLGWWVGVQLCVAEWDSL